LNQITLGVVGSGLMGVGIATQAALHGYATIVQDIDAARLASVHGKAEAILDELIDAGVFTPDNNRTYSRVLKLPVDWSGWPRRVLSWKPFPKCSN
jgi:3-hydroxyacyl-CoA dehydrogenase